MPDSRRTLVVGTTSDYIDWIRRSCPGKALFLTGPDVRKKAVERPPLPLEELLVPLSDPAAVLEILEAHLARTGLVPDGIACFDCECMGLAAFLADRFGLPYPSEQAISLCRDKYLSKLAWLEHQVPCPATAAITSLDEARGFVRAQGGPCVLKPLRGSGSELVFRVTDPASCDAAFLTIEQGLKVRKDHPLFRAGTADDPVMVAEAWVDGTEYSADFILEGDALTLIRIARKIRSSFGPFGTIQGYVIPGDILEGEPTESLAGILLRGAQALGLTRALCMVDFILGKTGPVLLEMTPRPGGDCLPHMLWKAAKVDILRMTLDFAARRPVWVHPSHLFAPHLGVRLHARSGGILRRIDTSRLEKDARVRDIHLIAKPGHVVTLPPADYDSWVLGHITVRPDPAIDLETQCRDLADTVILEMDPS
ncbi:MAG: ATP-grasp domain-containing protein [Pseudomonadota bacterium]